MRNAVANRNTKSATFLSVIYRAIALVMGICLCLSACSDNKNKWQSSHPRSADEQWVAHGGGLINGVRRTNSLEALNASKQSGMRLIELDFDWTQDGHLVLTHDWDATIVRLFGKEYGQRTLAQFKSLKTSNLTPITAEELFAWLDANPDVVIITDIKSKVLQALKWIKTHYPSYAERFIPQIYHFKQYEPVHSLGYDRVILTLYLTPKKDNEVLNFCKTHPVWAVAMPDDRVLKGTLAKDLHSLQIPVYVHTVNDPEEIKVFFRAGVFGIYSDRNDLQVLKSLAAPKA